MLKQAKEDDWDDDQRLIISALPSDRLIVDAGPGTGKTAVACARVAHLVNSQSCEPTKIWIISFTRTAVAELRQRIGSYMVDAEDAHAIRIATLDSHAWTLHSGFQNQAKISGDYDASIIEFTKLLRNDQELQAYVHAIDHLIIDEAQDIVGPRADLIEEMLGNLNETCGVTIFADCAQSIYGFSQDEDGSALDHQKNLVNRVNSLCASKRFEQLPLRSVFRTQSKGLLEIFTSVRQRVLDESTGENEKFIEVVNSIRNLANGDVMPGLTSELIGRDDLLILYRQRGEALVASSMLRESNVPHRMRMSGLPICIKPWVAICLSEYTSATLTSKKFDALWEMGGLRPDERARAWELLVRFAGMSTSVIDMNRLTAILGRSRPPSELCSAELGEAGPIVGTIHASKGREAPTVHLMLPVSASSHGDVSEETRVIFVGATRARAELLVGSGGGRRYSRLARSGRVFAKLKKSGALSRVQVEIGRDGDVGPIDVAGRTKFSDEDEVRYVQQRLKSMSFPVRVCALMQYEKEFAYALIPDSGVLTPLGYLSAEVNQDLFGIADQMYTDGKKLRPPGRINHLSVIGTRSIVLPPDNVDREKLHFPWAQSGIVLAPIVAGFTTLSFPYRKF